MNLPFGFNSPINAVVTLVVIVFVFFGLRELVAWYWKINRAIELLEKIEENTRIKDSNSDKKPVI